MERIGVLTSGGDAPGMNAAIRAVVRTCVYYNITPYGIYQGYEGLIQNDIKKMDAGSVKHIIHQGGTVLKSARSLDFKTDEGMQKAWENIQKHNLDGLVVIGGDGTFTGAMEFGEKFDLPIVGIPGTIDNDIYGTDFTVGFDTAVNTVVEAVDKIRDTATSHNRLFFIEVMGRDAGFIAVYSGIAAGSEEILIPEEDRGVEKLFESLARTSKRNKSSRLVIVAEGDNNGSVYDLEEKVKDEFGDRYETKVTILGHVQRGGRPSCADRVLASRLGVIAVEALQDGKRDMMVGIRDREIRYTDFEKATKQNPKMDKELLRIADIISI
ncbi:6-phosphofructokinase [Aliifodinibius salipaludis]|uniref:ATP-dependent 6-phosphofructokinase n=1 Tax=Fodinibius salipaludis TaxID=2032627 RepID=A0A2A2GF59_9BACT|nr:6-phosphofructokinase [Aliifodinibius salipaludis]PAU95634.1 6-phosphofructokinase [Aliifodinibius salipaludis]